MSYVNTELECFFDIAIDLLCVIDESGILRKVNAAWKKSLGYEPAELEGKNCIGLIHPDDVPSTIEAFHTVFEKGPVIDFENRYLLKDGSYRWIGWRGQIINGLLFAAGQDITDRKNFEEEIAETLKLDTKIFCTSPIGIATYNSAGKCISGNKSYSGFFGESVESILNLSIQEIESLKNISPSGFANMVLTTVNETKTEIHFKSPDNKEEWFDCNLTVFNSGDETLYLVLLQNITVRKGNEILIRESENRLKGMLRNIKLLALIIDAGGNIEFMNNWAFTVTGFTPPETLNKNVIDIFVKDPALKKEFRNLLETDSIPNSIEVETQTKNRGTILIKWSVTELRNENKVLTGAACIGEDITEFKLYENILNFRYQLIDKEQENDIVSLIRFTLDKAEELTGSKLSKFLFFDDIENTFSVQTGSSNTMRCSETELLPDTKFNLNTGSIWAESIQTKKPFFQNYYSDSPYTGNLTAGHVPVEKYLIFPIVRDDKIVAVITIGDKDEDYSQKDIDIISLLSDSLWNILYKKKTTDALKKSEEQLRALILTKDKFFSIIAHDLKSPFQGILGSLQILSSEFDDLSSEEIKDFIASIYKLSQNTYKLLENLLQWSRIQTERLEYNIQIINLKNALSDAIKLLANVAAGKNIKIHQNIPGDCFVKTDLNVMLTIFRNLLSNAIKFTNHDGNIHIYTEQTNGTIEIFVKDNGIGMLQEELDNLFQLQNQQHKNGTGGETGTGLGLIICKEMIEKIGGRINVKSEINKGTTFSFTLPKM